MARMDGEEQDRAHQAELTRDGEGLSPGEHARFVRSGGRDRQYRLYLPRRRAEGWNRWPVVLAFHGGGSTAEAMVEFCGLNETADRYGFAVVYPSGTGRTDGALTWNGGNCCGRALKDGIDDVGFVNDLLDDLTSQIAVDEGSVFATGMSNGAMLAYRVASELSDRIAAIAPVAGPMGTCDCRPTRPVGVCHFHGTLDEFAPLGGGIGVRSLSKARFFSVAHSIMNWVRANGCDWMPVVEELPTVVDDGTRVVRARHAAGRGAAVGQDAPVEQGRAEVVLHTIHGAGHTWPGRDTFLTMLGPVTKNISANEVMWSFFARHRRS